MRTRTIGSPGRYSATQGRMNATRAAGFYALNVAAWLVAAAGGLWALLSWLDGKSVVLPVVLLIAALFTVAVTRSKAFQAESRAGKQHRGTSAEEDVVRALQRARVSLVINGAELNAGGDADHVVAHDRGNGHGVLAVIETKAGGGVVDYHNGGLLTGRNRRRIPGDPIRQVQRQVAALARRCGRPVVGIVCVPWMTNEPFAVGPVVVCGTTHLRSLFHRTLDAVPLTRQDIDTLAHQVATKD